MGGALSTPALRNFTFSHSFEVECYLCTVSGNCRDPLYGILCSVTGLGLTKLLSGSVQALKPSLTTTSRRNLLAMGHRRGMDGWLVFPFYCGRCVVGSTEFYVQSQLWSRVLRLYCERKLSGPALRNFMFSHSFGVDKIIVGFRSRIKTLSDNIQKESNGNGPLLWYANLRGILKVIGVPVGTRSVWNRFVVGFRSGIKRRGTLSDYNIQKEFTGKGPLWWFATHRR